MFQATRKLLSIDCGADQRLKLARLLAFCQEMSIKDLKDTGIGIENSLSQGLLWVIGKQRYVIHHLPLYDSTIYLTSWSGKTLKALFPRYCEIKDGTSICIEGVSIWSLIKKKSRHFVFASDYGIIIPKEKYGNELPFPNKLIPPKVKKKAILSADYSNCDLNGHLNNASYIDFILSLIPISFIKKNTIKTLEIEYEKEIKIGNKMPLFYGKHNNDYWFYNEYFTIKLGFEKMI